MLYQILVLSAFCPMAVILILQTGRTAQTYNARLATVVFPSSPQTTDIAVDDAPQTSNVSKQRQMARMGPTLDA